MKYSKYFGAKRRGFIKSESILAPKDASHFKNENIKCDMSINTNELCYLRKTRAFPPNYVRLDPFF